MKGSFMLPFACWIILDPALAQAEAPFFVVAALTAAAEVADCNEARGPEPKVADCSGARVLAPRQVVRAAKMALSESQVVKAVFRYVPAGLQLDARVR
jgi:hypothetical protein